ncbi:MAG: 1-deoxy-D-xylulose-5-phosphate synthase [Clostridia bacterium]|nr:1-deoxy-D-xylulose-5-phosphate synthase [Clostridia bacterium]
MGLLQDIQKDVSLKQLDIKQLNSLSEEIRGEIIDVVKNNGGHLSANLGMVETTLALHYTLDLPKDKLVFDVGHQCYTHKLLSGRYDKFKTIRQSGGLSGFPEKDESPYDTFTTGHAGTSIASGIGMCQARDLLGEDYCVAVVVGDGSFSNGLNMEALSSSSTKPKNFIVILNDNGMSISKNKTGLYKYISKTTTGNGYIRGKKVIRRAFGRWVAKILGKFRDFLKRIFNRNNYFEIFGFKYVGVIDGNNVKEMTKTLKRVREACKEKAVLLHVKTVKGKGFAEAEEKSDAYHGVGKNFDLSPCSFSSKLGKSLEGIMQKDKRVVAVTAAMTDGTGLSIIEKTFPERFFDVGIAEEYAVTASAGMAVSGLKPVVALYSTFLQRAYDQVMHDVCLQNLPVVFCVDRAGFNGADGKTHQGLFDISLLSHLPNMTLLCPTSESDVEDALNYALSLNSPVAIRYPKSVNKLDVQMPSFKDGKWVQISQGDELSVICVGGRTLALALDFAKESGKNIQIIVARKIKPLDTECLQTIACDKVFTIEENAIEGGFGQKVASYFAEHKPNVKVTCFGATDKFIAHGTVEEQMQTCGLTVQNLIEKSNQ